MHIVVALNDTVAPELIETNTVTTYLVHIETGGGPLPVARGRNAGVSTALQHDAELLVFLDVDCIPGPDLLGRYHDVAHQRDHRGALLCGPVTYLDPPQPGGYPTAKQLQAHPKPHPARPAPGAGQTIATTDYDLFWSLSFAVNVPTWHRIGGFCELYRGYGGEDTDFGHRAAAAGVPMYWVGGADAFHQYHDTTEPPVAHLDDILRNAAIFFRQWGWWPMRGWLAAFEDQGLIRWDSAGSPRRI